MRRISSVIVIAASLAVGAAAWAQAAARYMEKRGGKVVVSLRLYPGGHKVRTMTIRYRVTCDNGGSAMRSTEFTDLPVNHSGRFSFRGTYTGERDGSKNHVTLRGRVTRKRASGMFKLRAEKGSLHCRSATVSWTAKRVR